MAEDNTPGAPEQQAAPKQQAAPPAGDWTDGLNDDLKGFVANKGWKDPGAVVQSYQELAKFAGAKQNYVEIPEAGDVEGVTGILRKLGAPESAEGYSFDIGEDVQVDENLLGSFKEMAAGASFTPEQAKVAVDWYNGQMADAKAAFEQNQIEQSEAAIAALKQEWGKDFDANVAAGQTLVKRLGLDAAEIEAFEKATSTAAVMNIMAKLGSGLGEKGLVGDETTSGLMTPHQANAKIAELGANKEFRTQLYNPSNPRHKSAVAEMDRLQRIAAGMA